MIVIQPAERARFNPDRMEWASLAVGEHLFAGLHAYEPHQEEGPREIAGQEKVYCVLAGQGDIRVGDARGRVGPGDLFMVPAGVTHRVRNPGPDRLVVVVVVAPAKRREH